MVFRDVRSSRLEAVARSFVRDRTPPACGVVVSSADEAQLVHPIACGLANAAESIGLPFLLIDSNESSVERHAEDPRLWILEAGGLCEEWFSQLDPPAKAGLDLLVWVSSPLRSQPLREAYLLGMLRWSLRPAKSVVLISDLGDSKDHSDELRGALRSLQGDAIEVFQLGRESKGIPVLRQLLQSVLSAGSRPATKRRARMA